MTEVSLIILDIAMKTIMTDMPVMIKIVMIIKVIIIIMVEIIYIVITIIKYRNTYNNKVIYYFAIDETCLNCIDFSTAAVDSTKLCSQITIVIYWRFHTPFSVVHGRRGHCGFLYKIKA